MGFTWKNKVFVSMVDEADPLFRYLLTPVHLNCVYTSVKHHRPKLLLQYCADHAVQVGYTP